MSLLPCPCPRCAARWLKADAIKPWQCRSWIFPRDPAFALKAGRVRAHVFICMLAAYLIWHLRHAWAPLTFTDEHRPEPADPVAPAQRSVAAQLKASTRTTTTGEPAYSFTGLLDHLATLTRNDIRYGTEQNTPTIPTLATPTTIQRQAFELIGRPIPINLK